MFRLFASSLFTFLLIARARAENPVCIIGSGPSGLSAAYDLEAKNKSVIIFEKQATVGGKCQAVYDSASDSSIFHPLGALFFTNDTYTQTRKIIDLVGQPIAFDLGTDEYIYSVVNGSISAAANVSTAEQLLIVEEIYRYIALWELEFGNNSGLGVGYTGGVPDGLTVTTEAWLEENSFEILPAIFIAGTAGFGYGDIRKTPILYMLQYFQPDVIEAFVGLVESHIIDFHAVFEKFSKYIEGTIKLSSPVTKIDRSGEYPIVTYTSGNSTETQECSDLILAFPPTESALKSAGLDMTVNETDIFSPVLTTNYFCGAVNMSSGVVDQMFYRSQSALSLTPPPGYGEPILYLKMFNDSDIVTTWSWGEENQTVTLAEADDLLVSTMAKVNRAPTAPISANEPLTAADIVDFWEPVDYFPHFTSAQLADGVYEKFDALQGVNHTYFASGLNGFEDVEFAVRAGQYIVSTYF